MLSLWFMGAEARKQNPQEKPVIGISLDIKEGRLTVLANYVRAVEAAGGIPYLLPMSHDSASVAAVIQRTDGLIITGGEDVNPLLYGKEPIPQIGAINTERDQAEEMLFKQARRRRIPILGICRGMQLINVLMGGTLCQDIPSQWKGDGSVQHSQKVPKDVATHSILIDKTSILHDMTGCDSMAVNSFHHQCIDRQAPLLRITAKAKDGVPEAFQCDKEPNIMGVQFHPEGLFANDKACLRILQYFIRQAKTRK